MAGSFQGGPFNRTLTPRIKHELTPMMQDLFFKEECFHFVGLRIKVHSKPVRRFEQIVHKDALEIEFINNKINYEREKPFKIENDILWHQFNADFFDFNSIIPEIKASQVKPGILINFGEPRLNFKSVICTY